MSRKYKVITLCGSIRFEREFEEINRKLTLAGNIVLMPALFGHPGDSEIWEHMSEEEKAATKRMLGDMHKRKIDMSDGIFVINLDGYIGTSTRSEICYAKMLGKEITFLVPISEEEMNTIDQKHPHKKCDDTQLKRH